MSEICQKRRVRSIGFVESFKRVKRRGRHARLYRARLSNAYVIFLYAWPTQSFKGVFQPKAITAAMTKISTKSRFMSKIVRKNGVGSIEFVTSLKRVKRRDRHAPLRR
jgi:hypothetical protein